MLFHLDLNLFDLATVPVGLKPVVLARILHRHRHAQAARTPKTADVGGQAQCCGSTQRAQKLPSVCHQSSLGSCEETERTILAQGGDLRVGQERLRSIHF